MANTYPQRAFTLPPGATELIIVRHGASAAAVPDEPFDLLDGHSDPPLAPEGEHQAQQVAERLEAEPLSALFVTPLQRTAQTAAPLAGRLGLEPSVIPQLREILLGDWEGGEFRIRAAHGDPIVHKLFEEERWDVIPGAERMEHFSARIADGLNEAFDRTGPDATGMAVLHGGVISEICHQVTGSRPFAFIQVDNASITRLVRFADGRLLLRSFNAIDHLSRNGGPSA
jgi:2,3-bisphosphoglycerate-dependent phosphoglycerate mutase